MRQPFQRIELVMLKACAFHDDFPRQLKPAGERSREVSKPRGRSHFNGDNSTLFSAKS